MGKKYKLATGQTLSTVSKTFKAGVLYDAAEIGKSLNSKNRYNEPYFVEASEQEIANSPKAPAAPARGGVVIKGKDQGKAPQAPQVPQSPAGDAKGAEGDGGTGGTEGSGDGDSGNDGAVTV